MPSIHPSKGEQHLMHVLNKACAFSTPTYGTTNQQLTCQPVILQRQPLGAEKLSELFGDITCVEQTGHHLNMSAFMELFQSVRHTCTPCRLPPGAVSSQSAAATYFMSGPISQPCVAIHHPTVEWSTRVRHTIGHVKICARHQET